MFVEGFRGLVGTSFEFRLGDVPAVTFSWWEEVTLAWAAIGAIVDRITKVVEREAQQV